MTRTTGVVSKWRWLRRVARIGTAAMLAISVLACGADDGDGGNALQTRDTLGLENGWVANAVVGSAGAPGGIFLLGGHRLDTEGSGYETRPDSFWMSAEGELNSIPAPPTEQGIGAGSGIALGDSLHVILQDCAVGGDPTSGGFACLSSDRLLRFYEFNLSDEVWTELELPAEIKAMERGYPTLVPGQVLEGGSVFFGVSTGQPQGVADLILGFDTSTDEWSTVSRGRPAVGNACSDGRAVYHLDLSQVQQRFSELRSQPSERPVESVQVDLLRADRSGGRRETVQFTYTRDLGVDDVDALGLIPHCMADGAVILAIDPNSARGDVPWPLRKPDGSWATVVPSDALVSAGPWTAVSLSDQVVFLEEENASADVPLATVRFDPSSQSWEKLPDRAGSVRPITVLQAGDGKIATFPAGNPGLSGEISIMEVGK